jgi:multicomponent Na+:H+ antiporter subunit D
MSFLPFTIAALIVPAVLLLAGIVVGLNPGALPGIETAAAHFGDHGAYARWVLQSAPPHFTPASHGHIEAFDYVYGAAGTLGAVAIAALTLFGSTLYRCVPQDLLRPARTALTTLRGLHSGHTGDYVAWWTLGTVMLGGASLILLT